MGKKIKEKNTSTEIQILKRHKDIVSKYFIII